MSPLTLTDRFQAAVRSQGLEITQARELVIGVVGSFKKHFNAEELLAEIRRRKLRVSRATVYRVLDLLVHLGLLRMTVQSSRIARYEISEGRTHHAHIICTSCRKIIEFRSPQIEKTIERICRDHGIKDYELTIEVVGTCEREGHEHKGARPAEEPEVQ